jgi:hypothetical protein
MSTDNHFRLRFLRKRLALLSIDPGVLTETSGSARND